MSTFKRQKTRPPNSAQPSQQSSQPRPCPQCGKKFKPYKRGRNGFNKKPFTVCYDCWERNKQRGNCAAIRESVDGPDDEEPLTGEPLEVRSLILSHNIFKDGQWTQTNVSSHPTVTVTVRHIMKNKQVTVNCIADSGAQSNLWGFDEFKRSGFSARDLEPVRLTISAANNHPLKIIGAFRAELKGTSPDGRLVSCRALIYVSESVEQFYLSYDAMRALAIVNNNFPTIGGSSQ